MNVLRRRSPRGALAYLIGRGDEAALARSLWLDDHGEYVLGLINAVQAFERIPDKWSDGDERERLEDALTYFTTPESDRTEAT